MNQDSKHSELTDEDLQQVSGGATVDLTTQQKVEQTTVQAACTTGEHIKKVVITW